MTTRSKIDALISGFKTCALQSKFLEIKMMGLCAPEGHLGIWWTNSSILPVIYDFQKYKRDVFVTQPCLRFFREDHDFPYAINPCDIRPWSFPYFHMQAAISVNLDKIIGIVEMFLDTQYESETAIIYVSSLDIDLVEGLIKSRLVTRIDSVRIDMGDIQTMPANENDYYTWKTFGAFGLHGRGAEVTIRMKNGKQKHVGQIMRIMDTANNTFAYSFGYGVEALLRRKSSDEPKYRSFSISDIVDHSRPGAQYIMDCVSTVCALQSIPGLEQSSTDVSRRGALLRREYRNLVYTCKIYDVNESELNVMITTFSEKEFSQLMSLPARIIDTYRKISQVVEKNEKALSSYHENLKELVSKGVLTQANAIKKLHNTAAGHLPVPQRRLSQILDLAPGLI